MFRIQVKTFRNLDKKLLIALVLLISYGFIVLNSATLSLERDFLPSQMVSTLIGFFILIFINIMGLDLFKKLHIPIYLFTVFLLVLVLIFGVGEEEWGANLWLRIGPLSFQASEVAKIGLILSLGRYVDLNKSQLDKPKVLLKILFFAFLPIVLVLLQPDTGTAIVMILIVITMLFTAKVHMKYFIGAGVLGLSSLPFVYLNLDDFQKQRILNFLNPERDLSNTGYQAMQSKIAIGSGRFLGKGLNQGLQTQYNFIPEKQTDFIFAVLVEELGFVGGFVLILLYALLLYRMIAIARQTRDFYSKLVVMGIFAMFLFHVFENIGMSIGLMPITGIPLPFFSYGGTFQIANIVAIGIVLAISSQKNPLSFK